MAEEGGGPRHRSVSPSSRPSTVRRPQLHSGSQLLEGLQAAEARLARLEAEREAALAEVTKLREAALAPAKQKSVVTAYALWLLCPLWPAYAFYLGRDVHCWLYTISLNGFLGIGWIIDGFCLPWYVADYNALPGYSAKAKQRMESRLSLGVVFSPVRLIFTYAMAFCFGFLVISLLESKTLDEVLGESQALNVRVFASLIAATMGASLMDRCVASVRTRVRPLMVLGFGALVASILLSGDSLKPEDGPTMVLSVSSFGIVAGCSQTRQFDLSRSPSRGTPSRLLPRMLLHGGGVLTTAGLAAAAVHLSGHQFLESGNAWQEIKDAFANRSFSSIWSDFVEAMRDPGADAASLLGIKRGASAAEIRAAHRRLARLHHPDKQSSATEEEHGAAEEMMRRLNNAKDVLLSELNSED